MISYSQIAQWESEIKYKDEIIEKLISEVEALREVEKAALEVAKRFTPASPDDMYALVDALKKLNEARK